MKKSVITETQIIKAIQEYKDGYEQNDICKELAIHQVAFNAAQTSG